MPFIPPIADGLDPGVYQVHSAGYRHPQTVPPGSVLVVGAANSGCQIAQELSATHSVELSASQAEAFSAEVCLVGVSRVNRQSRHAVCTTPTRGRGAGLSQREKSLKSQRPLEDLGTHPDCVQATAAQLARGECQVGGQGVDVDRVPGHQRLHGLAHQRIHAHRTSKLLHEVGLQEHERLFGRPGPGHRLHEAVR